MSDARETVKCDFTCITHISEKNTDAVSRGGGLAQWLGRRISYQGVPGSKPLPGAVRCGLEQVTFTHCLVLVKPKKR